MSAADIAMLVDMGFSMSRAERALQVTGNKGVEPAMEWLLAHSDDAEISPEVTVNDATPEAAGPSTESSSGQVSSTAVAKSMKCDECGKLFKSTIEAEFHAIKSGHDKFSESTEEKKPLTEEEKREKLKFLEERLRQKRKEREEKEKRDALEREKNRIRSGKEMAEARKKLAELEVKKLLEQRKREKEEEKRARQRVKAQIEADKAARRARIEGEKSNATVVSPASSTCTPTPKTYNQTKIQIRLTNGKTLVQTFGSREQLSAVRLYVQMNRTDGAEPFNLMTNFPKKVFEKDDYDMPLEVLGLVPSAVLIVQKKMV